MIIREMDAEWIWRIKYDRTEEHCVQSWSSFCILSFTVCKADSQCATWLGRGWGRNSEEWNAATSLHVLVWNSTLKAPKAGLLINIISLQTCSPLIFFPRDKCWTNTVIFFPLRIRVLWWASLRSCGSLALLVAYPALLPARYQHGLLFVHVLICPTWAARMDTDQSYQSGRGSPPATTPGPRNDSHSNLAQWNSREDSMSCGSRTETEKPMASVATGGILWAWLQTVG